MVKVKKKKVAEEILTRDGLADEIMELAGRVTLTNKKDCRAVVDQIFGAITATLTVGGEVDLNAFGKLTRVERAARMGRNPQTGKSIKIPAKKGVKFKPAKHLKDLVEA